MFPKSPMRQMYPNQRQQPYTPYPIPQLPPMAQKKKGFLAKLFKKHDPTEPFMQMVPPYRQMEGPPMMHQQPPPQYQQQYQPQYQPYVQQHPQQMIPPQMHESNDTRGTAATTATAAATSSSGIGSFFSNLISNPTNMINNIEKVSQVVQSVSPVVEQYGPIMRNIPNIVKILTSKKSTEENQTEDLAEQVEVVTSPPPPKKRKQKRKKIVIEPVIEKEIPEEPVQQTATKPKLYV